MKSNYCMARPSIIMFGIVIMLFFLEVGCSNNPPGPPDLTLTYEVVSKDPGKYKGKRVKWYGENMGGTFKEKGKGSSFKDAIFVDTDIDPSIEIHAFSASGGSEKGQISLMFGLMHKKTWVTGTVNGIKVIKFKLSGNGLQRDVEMAVLVLTDAQLEQLPEPPPKK